MGTGVGYKLAELPVRLIIAPLLGFIEALNERHVDAIDGYVGTLFRGPSGRMDPPEGIRDAAQRLWERLPDARVEIVSLTAHGDRVACEWRIRSSGLEMPLGGISLSRISEGKLTETRSYHDSEALRQDGVEGIEPLPL
jgi:predicted ester cyclase